MLLTRPVKTAHLAAIREAEDADSKEMIVDGVWRTATGHSADPTPGQLERSLDRVDRHEGLGTELVSGPCHAALRISDRMGEVYRG